MLEELIVERQPSEPTIHLGNRFQIDLSDADLVAELIRKRPEAYRLAVERFAPPVRRLLQRSLGPDSDIDDVQQEVFWCLFRRIGSLRDPLSLRPFVMAIALKTVLHERRSRRKLARMSLEPEPARIARGTKSDAAVASYALARLENLVLRLHKRERKTFVLRFVEGMTVSEIADALGISEATTRRSFTRAWRHVSKWAARDAFLSDYFDVNLELPLVE